VARVVDTRHVLEHFDNYARTDSSIGSPGNAEHSAGEIDDRENPIGLFGQALKRRIVVRGGLDLCSFENSAFPLNPLRSLFNNNGIEAYVFKESCQVGKPVRLFPGGEHRSRSRLEHPPDLAHNFDAFCHQLDGIDTHQAVCSAIG
jgi:hypothetical protein